MGGAVETWGLVDDRESIAAIHQAIDVGINLIDTAPIYGLGHAEEIVGKAIQGRRDRVVLATKCGLQFPKSPQSPPARSLSRANIFRECDESLRRMRIDQIDLYQCHWPDPQTPLRETMEAMAELLAAEKIRVIGVSNFGCDEIAVAREFAPVHALQTPLSLLQRRGLVDLLPYCRENQIATLAYGPLCKGLLTGKFTTAESFQDVRRRDPEFVGERYQRNLRFVGALADVARLEGRTVGQIALNWVLRQPGVTSAIVGAKRPSQVIENAEGAGWELGAEAVNRLQRILNDAEDAT